MLTTIYLESTDMYPTRYHARENLPDQTRTTLARVAHDQRQSNNLQHNLQKPHFVLEETYTIYKYSRSKSRHFTQGLRK